MTPSIILRSSYDRVETRWSELEAEAEDLNQLQSVAMCIVIGLFPLLLLLTLTIWFSPDHKQNLSNGVLSGVIRNGNVLIPLTLITSCL